MISPDQYARAVREALADHPDRDELLEDLDDHLAEIAEESDVPLEERLGPPAAYAEELAAAYGGRPAGPRRRRAWLRDAHARLLRQAPYRQLVAFLPELRPGWWVLRGYALAMVMLSAVSYSRLAPENPADVVAVAVGVLASIWYGRRSKGRLLVTLAVAANAVTGVVLFAGLVTASSWNPHGDGVDYAGPQPVQIGQVSSVGLDVYNIKPYAKDGTPLTDVYLYDQDGNPVTTNPQDFGFEICGEPVRNRYPLKLAESDYENADRSTCPSAAPSPATATEAPETATATPRPTPSSTK